MVRLQPQQIVSVPGGSPIMLFGSNSNRVFVSFLLNSGSGQINITQDAAGNQSAAFADIGQTTNLLLLRHDLGELITGEMYVSGGSGNSPNCDMTVVEGILV